jgi:hypothetical protein
LGFPEDEEDALGGWEVFENHEAFPNDNAMTKAFESAEEAMRQCVRHNLGGFVVHKQTAYFRRQNRQELKEKKIRGKGCVLYVAPPPKRRLSVPTAKPRRTSLDSALGPVVGAAVGAAVASSAVAVLVAVPEEVPLTLDGERASSFSESRFIVATYTSFFCVRGGRGESERSLGM